MQTFQTMLQAFQQAIKSAGGTPYFIHAHDWRALGKIKRMIDLFQRPLNITQPAANHAKQMRGQQAGDHKRGNNAAKHEHQGLAIALVILPVNLRRLFGVVLIVVFQRQRQRLRCRTGFYQELINGLAHIARLGFVNGQITRGPIIRHGGFVRFKSCSIHIVRDVVCRVVGHRGVESLIRRSQCGHGIVPIRRSWGIHHFCRVDPTVCQRGLSRRHCLHAGQGIGLN